MIVPAGSCGDSIAPCNARSSATFPTVSGRLRILDVSAGRCIIRPGDGGSTGSAIIGSFAGSKTPGSSH